MTKSISLEDAPANGAGDKRMMMEPAAEATSTSEKVLVMAPLGQDASAIATLLRTEGFETTICDGPLECVRQMQAGAGALVCTEEALALAHISELFDALKAQPPWSELSVVILTSGGETGLHRLLNVLSTAARGATALERPISQATLVRSLHVALSSRRRQYQVRSLLAAQAQLAAIVTSSDDAIVSKTLKGIVTSWNKGAERIFGYSAREMVGQSILRLIPREMWHEEDIILERLSRGERIEHFETIRVRKDGTRFPVSLTISPIRDESGRLLGASKIARDVTEWRAVEQSLRLAKEQAEAASHAKDKFLAALSHELRTPLNPVLMTATALREDERLPEDVKAQMEMIERNVLLEARLIDDLLDLSRIIHGKLALRSEACDAHSIIAFVVDTIRNEAFERAIGLEVDLQARHTKFLGDAARIHQVLWNLLRNAVKFTPKGGNIRVSTRDLAPENGGKEKPCLSMAVTDNGIGMDPAAIKRIFEPFEQVAPVRGSIGGLGLGLAIAKAIVDMHDGSIRAESAGSGKGSTFTVDLPVALELESDGSGGSALVGPADATGLRSPGPLRLLLVEDDEATLQVLTRILARDGHELVTAGSVKEALALAERQKFDALISDLGLPDGTGYDLMRELRDRYRLPGIALSGYGMQEDLHRSHEAGFLAHLVKPVDVNDLRRVLRHLAMVIRQPAQHTEKVSV